MTLVPLIQIKSPLNLKGGINAPRLISAEPLSVLASFTFALASGIFTHPKY